MYTIPNIISASRIILGFLFFTYYPNKSAYVFLYLGAISDIIDGWVARKFNLTSKVGEVLDPIADKIFWMLIIVKLYMNSILPKWFFLAILARDIIFFISFVYMYLMQKDKFKATWSGKLTAVIVGMTCVISLYETCPHCMHRLYVISLCMLLFNAFDYCRRLYK